jgi:HlyD family secretion protein
VRASILASGNLVFREQSQLSPEVLGKVRAVLVKEGDQVEAGQVVLQLDEEVYRAEVAQQQAYVRQQRINTERQRISLANQERQFERSKQIHARQLMDDSSYDAAVQALAMARLEVRASAEALQQAEAVLSQSSERLAKTEIRAPISGTVVALGIKVGETAVPGTNGIAGSNLMTIAQTGTLMTEANVDETDIARVRIGQEVAVYAAAFPDTALKGRVESIPLSPRSASESGQAQGALARSYSVKVALENTGALVLRPGMTCRAEIFVGGDKQGDLLAVPVQAVFSNNDAATEVEPGTAAPAEESFVFVADGDEAKRRVVKLGLSDDSRQQVTDGLKAGERVIVGPYKVLRHLQDGEAIEAKVAAAK